MKLFNFPSIFEGTAMRAKTVGALVVLAAALSACGGTSDDGAGSLVALNVSPNVKGVTGDTTGCYVGYVGDFVVSGGTPPYRLFVSDTDAIQLNTNVVSHRNGIFIVNFINGVCLNPGQVLIIDDQGNQITLTLTNKLAGST